MVLADLGRLFTRSIKYVFRIIRKVFYAKKLKKMRRAGRRATLVQQVSSYFLLEFGSNISFLIQSFLRNYLVLDLSFLDVFLCWR